MVRFGLGFGLGVRLLRPRLRLGSAKLKQLVRDGYMLNYFY